MCHFLPVYHLGIAFLGLGRRSKYNIRIELTTVVCETSLLTTAQRWDITLWSILIYIHCAIQSDGWKKISHASRCKHAKKKGQNEMILVYIRKRQNTFVLKTKKRGKKKQEKNIRVTNSSWSVSRLRVQNELLDLFLRAAKVLQLIAGWTIGLEQDWYKCRLICIIAALCSIFRLAWSANVMHGWVDITQNWAVS